MNCPRCKGVMAQEVFEDILDDTGNLSFPGWRCLTCGEILDPVIANHRGSHPMPLVGRSRKKFAAQLN